ncbi:unannotated protein [freshwater metagenome]|uniref:Unannotated protein n=1 Tax=freshwater metagenome TaxID=449393 RepID=A0A6J6GCL9_9ZZZZ
MGTVDETVTEVPNCVAPPDGAPAPRFASYESTYDDIDHWAKRVVLLGGMVKLSTAEPVAGLV